MRVRLHDKPKPNSYTESWVINVAGRWRERNVWYPGRSARETSERKPSNCGHIRKTALNAQKSAEAIVPQKNEGRAEPIQAGVTAGRRAA